MIPVIEEPELIHEHVDTFSEQGFVHCRSVYSPDQVQMFHELHGRAVTDWQFANGTEDRPDAVGGLLERFPREVFPALTHPLLLGFAEAVMGPFVQLDSAVLNSDPPLTRDMRDQPVMWHRDRVGSIPPATYVRPASIVFLAYLQQMTDAVGPLRVLPASHRQPRMLSTEEVHARLPEEVLVRAQPGDVVAIHHNLLDSGTRNTSDHDRQFFGFIYNLSTLRQEDNFLGPNCRALVLCAETANDRRLLRLLGADPLIFPRQNSGFTNAHESDWQHWREEDTEFARQASDPAEMVQRVRTMLSLPHEVSMATAQDM